MRKALTTTGYARGRMVETHCLVMFTTRNSFPEMPQRGRIMEGDDSYRQELVREASAQRSAGAARV